MEAPQRYETQKGTKELRFTHHNELRKGLGVWGFQRHEGVTGS